MTINQKTAGCEAKTPPCGAFGAIREFASLRQSACEAEQEKLDEPRKIARAEELAILILAQMIEIRQACNAGGLAHRRHLVVIAPGNVVLAVEVTHALGVGRLALKLPGELFRSPALQEFGDQGRRSAECTADIDRFAALQ